MYEKLAEKYENHFHTELVVEDGKFIDKADDKTVGVTKSVRRNWLRRAAREFGLILHEDNTLASEGAVVEPEAVTESIEVQLIESEGDEDDADSR